MNESSPSAERKNEFPEDAWQHLVKTQPMAELLAKVPDLKDVTAWPDSSYWQHKACDLGVWDAMGRDLRFAPERKLGQRARRKQPKVAGRTYESAIIEAGEVPFRLHDSHDFFNALIWLNFPKSKFALHARAYAIQKAWFAEHERGKRCALADRLTCFDEGGIILSLPEGIRRSDVEPLIQSRDDEAKRMLVRQHANRFILFGHGMMEVILSKGISDIFASCLIVEEGPTSLDRAVAKYLHEFDESTPDHGAINSRWLFEH